MAWKENGETLPNQIGRTQLKVGLFKGCIYIYRITWKHISLTWTNNAHALSEEYFKQPVERGQRRTRLVIVAERLRRFASSIWTLIAYRIDGNAATARHGVWHGTKKKEREREGERQWGVRCNVYENMLLSRREAHPPGNWMRGVCKIDNFVCVNSVATLPATHPYCPCLPLVTLLPCAASTQCGDRQISLDMMYVCVTCACLSRIRRVGHSHTATHTPTHTHVWIANTRMRIIGVNFYAATCAKFNRATDDEWTTSNGSSSSFLSFSPLLLRLRRVATFRQIQYVRQQKVQQ